MFHCSSCGHVDCRDGGAAIKIMKKVLASTQGYDLNELVGALGVNLEDVKNFKFTYV